jgi:hypothetical protein
VGIENQYGSAGFAQYYNGSGTAPEEGTSLKTNNNVDQAIFTYQLQIGSLNAVDVTNVAQATNTRTGRLFQAAATVHVGGRIFVPIVIR